MKLEVEPNMYVRTKEGYICRVLKLKEEITDDGYLDFNDIGSASIQKKNVIKASHTLLGNDKEPCLIEPGDYVNGYKVVGFVYDDEKSRKEGIDKKIGVVVGINLYDSTLTYYVDQITTIVTKEQFESMAYKVVKEC